MLKYLVNWQYVFSIGVLAVILEQADVNTYMFMHVDLSAMAYGGGGHPLFCGNIFHQWRWTFVIVLRLLTKTLD